MAEFSFHDVDSGYLALAQWAAAVLLSAGCAQPLLPAGGPVDRTPPALVSTVPANGTVSFVGDHVRLEFTEYIDQASLTRSFSIAPAPIGRLQFRWSRKRVDVVFPEPFQDSTTYVLTLGTELRDAQGVKLTSPITLAFATGPQIDQGRVTGSVVEPIRGEGVADLNILAYGPGDSTPHIAHNQMTRGDLNSPT